MILKELRRICKGPIIVSFFCNTMIYKIAHCEGIKYHNDETKHHFRLSRKALTEEVRKRRLIVDKWVPKYALGPRQASAVLVRD